MFKKHFLVVLTKESGIFTTLLKKCIFAICKIFTWFTPFKFTLVSPPAILTLRGKVESIPHFEFFLDTNKKIIQNLNEVNEARFLGLSIPETLSFNFVSSHSEELPYTIEVFKKILSEKPYSFLFVIDPIANYRTHLLQRLSQSLNIRSFVPLFFFHFFATIAQYLWESWNVTRQNKALIQKAIRTSVSQKPMDLDQKTWLICLRKRLKETLLPLHGSIPSVCVSGEALDDKTFFVPSILSLEELLQYQALTKKAFAAMETKLRGSSLNTLTSQSLILGDLIIENNLKILRREVFSIFLNIAGAKRLFEAHAPKNLVSVDPTPISVIFFTFAKQKSIPTYLYVTTDDGYPVTRSIWADHLIADRILTINENQKKFFEAFLAAHGRTKVLQQIGVLSQNDTLLDKQTLSDRYNLDPTKPWILFGSRHTSEVLPLKKKQLFYKAAKHLQKELNVEIIFKCHPHESTEQSSQLAKNLGIAAAFISSKDGSQSSFYGASDCMVNIYESSVTIEALKHSVPVVIFGMRTPQKSALIKNTSYENFDAVLFAETSDALIESVKRILNDPNTKNQLKNAGKNMVEYFFGPQDGMGLQRLKDAVLSLR